MIRWACCPILALLLVGCASAPVEKPAAVGTPHASGPPRIPTLTAENAIHRAPPAPAPPTPAPAAPPRRQAAVAPRPAQPATRKPAARPQAVPRPKAAAPPEPEDFALPVSTPPAPPGICPELAVSYCLGHLAPPLAVLAQLPPERLRALRRCELDLYMTAPALFGIEPAGSPNPLTVLRDHCSADYAAIRARIGARIRLEE